jgi:hypothetical protein
MKEGGRFIDDEVPVVAEKPDATPAAPACSYRRTGYPVG